MSIPSASTTMAPWGRVMGYSKKEQSVIGDSCEVGDKVTMKQCSVGTGCKVGAKTKLNSCVLMDGAIVGERFVKCTITYLLSCYNYSVSLQLHHSKFYSVCWRRH